MILNSLSCKHRRDISLGNVIVFQSSRFLVAKRLSLQDTNIVPGFILTRVFCIMKIIQLLSQIVPVEKNFLNLSDSEKTAL